MDIEIKGYKQLVFCRLCKDYLYSFEDIQIEERKLNKNETRKAEIK